MPSAPDHTAQDLQSFGAPQAEIDRWLRENGKEEQASRIELPPDCERAVRAFLSIDTQWRRIVGGARLIALGLDYAGVESALRMQGIRRSAELFADLKLMEDEALISWAEKQ